MAAFLSLMTPTTAETPVGESYSGTLEASWRQLALAGGVIMLLGLLAITFPFLTGLSLTLVLGVLLIVSGIVHGAHAFTVRGWRGSLWQLSLAVLSVIAGIVVLTTPVVGLVTLTLLVIAYLLVDGIVEGAMALRMAGQPGRGSIAVSAIVSLLLAGVLWSGFPTTAAWAIGVLVGVSLLVTGLSMVVVAYSSRDSSATITPPAGEPHS